MSGKRRVHQRRAVTYDELVRLVLDLRMQGYPTSAIAGIMDCSVSHIQHLLKLISAELAAEVKIAERTHRNAIRTQRLLHSIIRKVHRVVYVREQGAFAIGEAARVYVREQGAFAIDEAARARVAAFREGWFRAGASTEPADRPRAEAA